VLCVGQDIKELQATATTVYLAIGGAGYLMFGRSVHDEVGINALSGCCRLTMQQISIDLLNTPGYSAFLNTLALWTFVISPLSKYALTTRPVNMTLEIMFGLEERLPPTAPDDQSAKPRTLTLHGHPPGASRLNLRRAGVVFERVGFTLASIAVSIFVPAFSSVMALIGAGAAFLLCVVGTSFYNLLWGMSAEFIFACAGPLFAKRSIHGQMSVWDGLFIIIAAGMAVWGTTAAFWTAGDS
jgi:vesicular inhibitory amino acid transporter